MNEKIKIKKNTIKTDALLKETSSNYIRLIGDADRKARILLLVNSILLTLGLTMVTKIVSHVPHAWTSATFLMLANLFSLFFCILSVRPEIKAGNLEAGDNILHYSKCREFSFQEYREMILTTMQDNDKKLESVIKELYFYGNLLSMKYRLMKIAYRFFYWGVAIAVISYLVILYINGNDGMYA